MGDRTYTQIQFSGTISEEQAAELIELLEAQGCELNVYPTVPLSIDALRSDETFYDGECNYAQMEDIEAWCGENRVSYLKSWEPGGGYGPGMDLYDAIEGKTYSCTTVEGEPAITLSTLKQLQTKDKLDDEIAHLSRFSSGLGSPLKVLKVNEWTDDLCKFMAERALTREVE